MSVGELFKKEWGAVSFVLTVFVGAVAVLLAFLVFHQSQAATVSIPDVASPTPVATASVTPAASPSAAASASPAATPSP